MPAKSANDDIQLACLAFAPILLSVTTAPYLLATGLLIVLLSLSLGLFFYLLRSFIPPRQRLVSIMLMGAGLILTSRLLLEAMAYPWLQEIGVLFPLLLFNSYILSNTEAVFSLPDGGALLKTLLRSGLAILALFALFAAVLGLLRPLAWSITPPAWLFIAAFMLAANNYLKSY